MRLETIAEMLGHRSMDMTLVYARIANRVVADEYNAVMEGRRALQDGGGSDGISG
jgi:integrase